MHAKTPTESEKKETKRLAEKAATLAPYKGVTKIANPIPIENQINTDPDKAPEELVTEK